jgi:hypothetical protein
MIPIRVMTVPVVARLETAPMPPPEICMKKVMQSEVTKAFESQRCLLREAKE